MVLFIYLFILGEKVIMEFVELKLLDLVKKKSSNKLLGLKNY